ncbi:MAG: hypothetical protein CVV22_06330 [Ignavibacteriae bacterium HGW-Ignavibacteriae-1]|jgi:hypothetical protein|nr:MAG: hypothetical protein CVV22_06330 [Ignavibacteriae bacterium HGW-Ignavibacteriae-1]
MNRVRIFAASILLTLFAISCNNNAQEKMDTENHSVDHDAHNHGTESIELNNNEKWHVNEEMKPFIIESEKVLNTYTETESNDYLTLASQLKSKNSELINSCTMQGKSHDELHKWLHPHMDLIEKLENAENENDANVIISDLKASFNTYHTYFQ